MLLLKIVNKLLLSHNLINYNSVKHLCSIIGILIFTRKEMFTFFVRWLLLFVSTNSYSLHGKANYFVSYIYFSSFYNQKLISYIININLLPTNTLININNIKGNPTFFYSAGMLSLQKKQKTRQPKAILLILRALLMKFKLFRTNPVAIHINNLFSNDQVYILKKLKQKIFMKLIVSYRNRPHNGCRLKKRKRIKIRTRTK